MKAKVKIETEIEAVELKMCVAVRYEEEDIPNDFPGRSGDALTMRIEIDTGKIIGWPEGVDAEIESMKVCDQGCYSIFDPTGKQLAELNREYVPHGLVPGEYGDYIKLKIEKGIITNWPKKPNLKEFFPDN